MNGYIDFELARSTESLRFTLGRYITGNVALSAVSQAFDEDWGIYEEPYATVSVNLETPLSETCRTIFTDDNVCRTLVDAMVEKGLLEPTGNVGHSGWCTYREMRLTDKLLEIAEDLR